MNSIAVEQTNSSNPNTKIAKICCKCLMCIVFLALLAMVIALLVLYYQASEFKFQVQSVEARLASSSNLDSNAPSSSSELGSDLGLDVNVTLSVINSETIVFESLLVSLAHDNSNSKFVLSSKTVQGFRQESPGQVNVEMKDVRIFDNYFGLYASEFTLSVEVEGKYWPLSEEHKTKTELIYLGNNNWMPIQVEDDTIDKSKLKMTCKGIKIALPSSSNDVTTGSGPLPCSKTISF